MHRQRDAVQCVADALVLFGCAAVGVVAGQKDEIHRVGEMAIDVAHQCLQSRNAGVVILVTDVQIAAVCPRQHDRTPAVICSRQRAALTPALGTRCLEPINNMVFLRRMLSARLAREEAGEIGTKFSSHHLYATWRRWVEGGLSVRGVFFGRVILLGLVFVVLGLGFGRFGDLC